MIGKLRWLVIYFLVSYIPSVHAAPPTTTDARLIIELVAKEPDIVTPTGLAVDERGRIWVIENNTHQRPPNYRGPASDRVRVFEDFDSAGRSRKISTFAEGFKNAMSIALGKYGEVFLATRSDVYLLRDTRNTGVADERRVIVKLDSPGDYPHNGLSGFAFDALDNLYFSLGENLGAPYKLIGSDGTTLSGGGEGGSIYRCRQNGTGLVRIATGFWNTFHLTVDAFGRLFAVDNDPDSRGPCRLLHIVPGGDYGYRYRNGRKGLHPFTAWNGELPGTLPMVAGTSEAPSGIVAYESTGLPQEYVGNLLATSWGDHVVERFKLVPRGASFTSQAQIVVRGGEDFRPVAIATAPDGSLYLSDWVDKSYPVHGKGRIWRIRMKTPPTDDGLRPSKIAMLETSRLRQLLHHPKIEIRAAAADALARNRTESKEILSQVLRDDTDPRARLHALWACAKLEPVLASELIASAWKDPAPEVRGEAVRLLGQLLPSEREKRRDTQFLTLATKDPSPFVRAQAMLQITTRPALDTLIPILADNDPFLAAAVLDVLGRPEKTLVLLLQAGNSDPKVRLGVLIALRRGGSSEGRTTLTKFLADVDPGVRRAAIQWVGEERLREYAPLLSAAASQPPVTRDVYEALLATNELLANVSRKPSDEPSGQEYIVKVVTDASQPPALRAVALRMLRADHPALAVDQLKQFVLSKDKALQEEAVRSLVMRTDGASQELLRDLAGDRNADMQLRAQAVMGLAHSALASSITQARLLELIGQPELQRDVLRSLRDAPLQPKADHGLLEWWDDLRKKNANGEHEQKELAEQLIFTLRASKNDTVEKRMKALAGLAGPRPRGEAEWRAVLTGRGDAAAGERVFFHARGPRCSTCHRVDGRGSIIGPDLSSIGRGTSRDKLIESILAPSKEIAPQYTSWLITTRDGKVRTGVIVEEGPNSTVTVADNQGKLEVINRTEIEERHALTTSIMPDNLHDLMTRQEFRDLIEFLVERK